MAPFDLGTSKTERVSTKETYGVPNLRLSEFQKKLHEAFLHVLEFERSRELDLLERFRFAYEYRKRFDWLGESGKDGLVFALKRALALYPADSVRDVDQKGRQKLDIEFTKDLAASVEAVVLDPVSGAKFAHSLWYASVKVDIIPTSELSQHVVKALNTYCDRYNSGTSIEPW